MSPFYQLVANLYTSIKSKWYLNVIRKHILSILSTITNSFARYDKNKICTYDLMAFRDFQIDLCKTVVSGTYDGLALNGKHGLHLRYWNWLITMWSDTSLFICYQNYGISYLHLIIKQKNASPENWSKCTYDLIAFNRRSLIQKAYLNIIEINCLPLKSIKVTAVKVRHLASWLVKPNMMLGKAPVCYMLIHLWVVSALADSSLRWRWAPVTGTLHAWCATFIVADIINKTKTRWVDPTNSVSQKACLTCGTVKSQTSTNSFLSLPAACKSACVFK